MHEHQGSEHDSRKIGTGNEAPSSLGTQVATVAVVGVGVLLLEAELLPGLLLGAAAVLAPKLLPNLGNAMRPLMKTAIRAGYATAAKTREVLAEANEQIQDMAAEARAEQAAPETPASPVSHAQARPTDAAPAGPARKRS